MLDELYLGGIGHYVSTSELGSGFTARLQHFIY
jgi:hypothetical protein